jgi:hypothetical protein
MLLIFAPRRPNVDATADFGINMALRKAYRMRKMPTPKWILQISKRPLRPPIANYRSSHANATPITAVPNVIQVT